ncbi:MAG TPA: serine/threonine-protein kinase [Microbacterium sp.]|uniref:serine/threonine-protein kinase n=1 Tax=Microbacterium sp. TaxID=51671 RepID=UPI002C728A71|nr:serine/threonine-protein kinase [Microbacterium sp.]HWI32616.1 serine/threonine-protein kinase [Microbacterium sp.]
MRPTQGVSFGGRYELISRIAIGGMGEVWEATDHVIGRTVAIKILKDEYMGDPGFLERFRAEARHAALVNHEGIASVFDYGEENGSAFLVMELVPGEALSTIIERDGSLGADKTLDIVAQTSAALQAAHAAGLVHRDIKPGNLLITPDGRVKITDFGIARIADQVPLTATGQVMGTVQYLSPEQASGHPASPATDTYSLGIVAYECLAGKRPFTGESQVAIAMAQINEQPPPLPPTVAVPVQNLVMAMIAKKPDDRPASSAAVARAASALRRGDVAAAAAAVPAIATGARSGGDDVTQLLGASGEDTTRLLPAAPVPSDEEPTEKRKRSPWTWPLIALIVLLLLVLGGTLWAVLANQTPSADPTNSSTSKPPSPSSATPTPSETRVDVDSLGLLNQTCDAASEILVSNDLVARCAPGNAAPSDDQVGLVYDFQPKGRLEEGTTVDLTVYAEVVSVGSPENAPTITEAGVAVTQVSAGSTVQLNWQNFTCPSGTGTLSQYTVVVSNATFTSGPANQQVFAPTVRQANIIVTGPVGATVSASYTATCNAGPRDSGSSPPMDVPIVAGDSETPPPAGEDG